MKKNITILKLNWNQLHIQSREEICHGAAMSERLADRAWNELELWTQMLLADSLEKRSKGKLWLCGGPFEP